MGYIGTSALIKSLGISKKMLYHLIESGEVSMPIKQGGRYWWSEQDATAVVCALARRSTQDALAFTQKEKRYLGGKAKYSEFIRNTAERFCPGFESFADYFAGAGGSAAAFSDKVLIVNDLLYSSQLFLQAWYGSEQADLQKISRQIAEYNRAEPAGDNYVSNHFGGKYFGPSAARKIGYIREDIEQKFSKGQYNGRERAILIASLLHAMDEAANVYAHYDTFKSPPIKWNALELRMPAVFSQNNPQNRIFNTDANMLAAYTYSDVAYLDPPMDSRQYSDIYHLPENIAMWNKPELKGKTMKSPRGHIKSLYCKKGAGEVFAQLVDRCKAKVILAALPEKQEGRGSRSSAKLSTEEMLAAMQAKGRVHIVFPPFAGREDGSEQMLLSYEFKKSSAQVRESANLKGGLIVCECEQPQQVLVDSPINFTGGKYRELERILPYFPAQCRRFWDVFAGGCSVGLNAAAQEVVFVDRDGAVMALLEAMQDHGDAFILEVERIISAYGLSKTWEYGYGHYGVTAEEGLAGVNREAYGRLREDFNQETLQDAHYYAMLYVLLVYGFNNMPRFNRAGEFNLPVGKRDWNSNMQEKLRMFLERLKKRQASFYPMDFRRIDVSALSKEDFLYFDPPYMGAETYYNRSLGWTEQDERDLMKLLDQLDAYGIRYALSTVRSYGGVQNEVLEQWLTYGAKTHRIIRRDAQDADKVLILNY